MDDKLKAELLGLLKEKIQKQVRFESAERSNETFLRCLRHILNRSNVPEEDREILVRYTELQFECMKKHRRFELEMYDTIIQLSAEIRG